MFTLHIRQTLLAFSIFKKFKIRMRSQLAGWKTKRFFIKKKLKFEQGLSGVVRKAREESAAARVGQLRATALPPFPFRIRIKWNI